MLLAMPDERWQIFKQDHSGTVAAGTIEVAGVPLQVVIKRPQPTRPGRALVDLVRRSRARRAWRKTWTLLSVGLPVELPLLVADRRRAWGKVGKVGKVEDQVALYARVPGQTIKGLALNELAPDVRAGLLRDVGHVLRRTSDLGFNHLDAKTSNWIATPVEDGLRAVMLDCDGVRRAVRRPAKPRTRGLDRFLRALRDHPDATESDVEIVRTAFEAGPFCGRSASEI